MSKMSWAKLATLLRKKFRELYTFTAVEGNYIYIYKEILYQQGFWPALDRKNQMHASRFRYWYPRFILAMWTYLTLIGFPMAAYSAAGQSFLVQLEPIVFSFVVGIGVSIGGSLLFQSELFQETIEAYEAMKESARILPEQFHENTKLRKIIGHLLFLAAVGASTGIQIMIPGVLPFLILKRTFFFWSWYPYDEKASPFYEITLALWVVWLSTSALLIIPAAEILVNLLVQAWSHLELLNHNVSLIRESSIRKVVQRVVSNKAEVKIKRYLAQQDEINAEMEVKLHSCVLYQQAIVRFVGMIGPTYDYVIRQLLAAFLIPFGLIIFSIQNTNGIGLATVWQLIAVFAIAGTLLLTFFFADKISEQSCTVTASAFACDWLETTDSFKRSLRILMSFSNEPLVITVARGIPLSLVTCRKLFFLTYKYYNYVNDLTSRSSSTHSQNSVVYLAMPKTT